MRRLRYQPETLFHVSEIRSRKIRQEIARVRLDPRNRNRMAEQRLADLKTAFNRFCREAADPGVSDRFDEHGVYAQRALDRGDEKGADEAETHLGEMESLYMRQLWQEPGYIVSLFQRLAQEGYLAVDPAEYQRLVREGETALERNDIDGLRRSIFALWEAQINVGGVDKEMARLATIVRS